MNADLIMQIVGYTCSGVTILCTLLFWRRMLGYPPKHSLANSAHAHEA